MAQIEPLDSHESCEPPSRPLSRSSLFFIGTDSRGNWVVRDQAGLCGGLFVNRSEALRFAMLENGCRPRAVIMVPGILEFSIGGQAKAVVKDSTGVVEAKAQPTVEFGLHSSQVNLESGASWSPHSADHTPSPDATWRHNLSSRYRFRDPDPAVHDSAAVIVAAAYNQAGGDYVAYADGDPTHLFAFDGLHAYADRRVWTLLEAKLTDLRATGNSSISILDAGCGPGTWLRRLVTRAHALGFTTITTRGFDVARVQIQRARLLARDLCGISGVNLTFDVAYGRTA